MSPTSAPRRTHTLLGRLGRLAWALAALMVLLALVGGVPAALWVFVGWPLPHALPTLAELGRGLTQHGIPDTILIDILALGCWAAWAVFTASLVVEAGAAVRGRTARRIPLAGPLQALAGALVAAVLLAFAPMAPRAHAQTLPGGPLPAALAAVEPAALVPPALGPSRPLLAEPPPARHLPARAAPASQAPRRYIVKPRDTLWGIADRELGDPFRWHDLYRRNKDKPQPDGGALTDPDLIRPGWTLELPASTLPSQPGVGQAPPPAQPRAARPGRAPDTHQPEQAPPTATPPTTTPSVTGSPAPEEGSRPQPPSQPAGPARPAVELPSGAVVGLSLAGGIAVALAAARLHQRRRRRLGEPRPGITHVDPLVTPAVQRLRHAARAARASLPDSAGHAPDQSPDYDPDLNRADGADAMTPTSPSPRPPRRRPQTTWPRSPGSWRSGSTTTRK